MPAEVKRKVVVAGGNGFLGRNLKLFLEQAGFSVSVLTRNPKTKGDIQWDAKSLGDWAEDLDGSFALINLAGRTVDCRYNEKNKAAILNSRIDSTNVLHQAVAGCNEPPAIWMNSSTSTIYNDTRGNAPANTEVANNIGDDFSMGVARKWEACFFDVDLPNTVQTALRTAIVMGRDGGAFPIMSKIARFGLCSPQGAGDQWISWLHIEDFCRAVLFLLHNPIDGTVNLCSPNPIQNRDFNQLLREQVKPWFTLPQPVWLLKLGAIFLQTEPELILKSRKVAPARLHEAGFEFEFAEAKQLLQDLINTD